MKKVFFASMIASFVVTLVVGFPRPVDAAAYQYNLINETNTTYTAMNRAAFTSVTYTGYGGHSYKAYNSTDPNWYEVVTWKCTDAFPVEYNWHTYIG